MKATDVIVIGAGQAGLATSYCLGRRGIEHLVLDRGRIGERWRSERWDSLKLLTPNWQSRLPGHSYRGPTPDGFMSMPEVVALLEGYAAVSSAPIQSHTRVVRVALRGSGFDVHTDHGDFHAPHVVIATGWSDVAGRPGFARRLSERVFQLGPTSYRNPGALPPGGVLVVGASASGAQIADQLARAGREVTLAVGRHTRLPRRYRGADIMTWLDAIGSLDETRASVGNAAASLDQPSLQLMGSDPPRDLDLATLARRGVRIAGRAIHVSHERVMFGTELAASIERAEQKLNRILDRIDRHIENSRTLERAAAADRPAAIDARRFPTIDSIDLRSQHVSSVVWATGFRRDYRWLQVPIFGADDEIIHTRGVTPAAGLYAVGLRFQHTRKSNFIDGVGADADYVVRDIAARLGVRESCAA